MLSSCLLVPALLSACSSGSSVNGAGGQPSTSLGGAASGGDGGVSASAGRPSNSGGSDHTGGGDHAGGGGDHTGGAAGAFVGEGGAAGSTDAGANGVGDQGGEGGADAQASCTPGETYGGGEASLSATSVTAALVDENGAPVSGQITYICGLDLCSASVKTNSAGQVSLQLPANFAEKRPAFKYGDLVQYAAFAIPLTNEVTDFTTGGGVLATGKLSDKLGATLAPGSDATSGDVTVSAPAGGAVLIDTLIYDTAENQKFRAVKIPLTHLGPVLASAKLTAGEPSFALVYGVAPSGTQFCPAAKLSVALPHETPTPYNDLGWAPGTAVELWVAGIDLAQTFAPYAGWAKASDAVVSSDGASVATHAGKGVLVLGNFALRKAP